MEEHRTESAGDRGADRCRLLVNYMSTHGGLTSDYVFGPNIPFDLFLEHDRLLRDNTCASVPR